MKHVSAAIIACFVAATALARESTQDLDQLQKQIDAAKAAKKAAADKTAAEARGMVVIPAGSFAMGSAAGDSESFDNEHLQHTVPVRSFAGGAAPCPAEPERA